MKYIILKTGERIEVDDTPYYIANGILYVYTEKVVGWGYVPFGEVDKMVEE